MKYLKEYRLTRKADIQSVFAHPLKVTHKQLIALYCPNLLTHPRLGIILTKARVPKAVDRNRIKRAIRESFRALAADIPAVDMLIMLRGKPTISLREDIDNLLKNIEKK